MSNLQKGSAVPLISAGAASPPIVAIARILGHVASTSYGFLSRTTVALLLALLAPLSLLYNPLAYLLAPLYVFASVLLDIFVFTPYAVFVAIARNVYPIYVFVGSAVLCALMVGFLARALSVALTRAFFGPPSYRAEQEVPATTPVESKEKSALGKAPSTPKTRLRKRVSIKEEKSK